MFTPILPGLVLAAVLLAADLLPLPQARHAVLSALPLALAGAGYALYQLRLRPAPGVLFKRLLLAATFVTWAVVQLLPTGRLATVIGDLVIAAYVLDLHWLTRELAPSSRPQNP